MSRKFVCPGIHKWSNTKPTSIYDSPVLVTIPYTKHNYKCQIGNPSVINKHKGKKRTETQLEMHANLIANGYAKTAEEGDKWIYSKICI